MMQFRTRIATPESNTRSPLWSLTNPGKPVGCRHLRPVFLTVALILASIIACGGNPPDTGEPDEGQIRGIVVQVAGRNIIELKSLRIRDETGNVWDFRAAEGFIGISPSHLREHQLAGESVLVTYVIGEGELIAVDITD